MRKKDKVLTKRGWIEAQNVVAGDKVKTDTGFREVKPYKETKQQLSDLFRQSNRNN